MCNSHYYYNSDIINYAKYEKVGIFLIYVVMIILFFGAVGEYFNAPKDMFGNTIISSFNILVNIVSLALIIGFYLFTKSLKKKFKDRLERISKHNKIWIVKIYNKE